MSKYRKINSVNLALDCLEVVATHGPISGKMAADALNQPMGTVMCHLETLSERGFLKRDDGRYDIGLRNAVYWAKKRSKEENRIKDAVSALKEIGVL